MSDSLDYSLPGSSVHGIFQARIAACYFLLQGIFPTQGSKPGLLHCRQTLYRLSHLGSLDKPYEKGIIVIRNLFYR